jgi:Fur family transcriptional regulator, zinc uptake regulator
MWLQPNDEVIRNTIVNALEMRCVAGKRRLTLLRRQVLELLLEHGGQATAYELIEDLPLLGRRASPASVYRALEFLMEIGFVRHLSSNSTFVVSDSNASREHAVFLVCTVCGATEKLENEQLARTLVEAAGEVYYEVHGYQTEVNGICGACQRERDVRTTSKDVVANLDSAISGLEPNTTSKGIRRVPSSDS